MKSTLQTRHISDQWQEPFECNSNICMQELDYNALITRVWLILYLDKQLDARKIEHRIRPAQSWEWDLPCFHTILGIDKTEEFRSPRPRWRESGQRRLKHFLQRQRTLEHSRKFWKLLYNSKEFQARPSHHDGKFHKIQLCRSSFSFLWLCWWNSETWTHKWLCLNGVWIVINIMVVQNRLH